MVGGGHTLPAPGPAISSPIQRRFQAGAPATGHMVRETGVQGVGKAPGGVSKEGVLWL